MTTMIQVDNLSKAFRIGMKDEVPDTLVGAVKSTLSAPLRNLRKLKRLDTSGVNSQKEHQNSEDIIWALKDVSFKVQQGDVVGIIGKNGAGKSTLLKILSRITEPTAGHAKIRGRVSSLLEVGTGFHPELTGRDNIYMNGTILGMMKKEIDRRFDEIVDFSGVEKFLDTPTKRYSSGMQVRLAFAVAAHLEPEVLIVDEVLAVGDMEFQKKCINKMQDISTDGRTVLFVSHNMGAIESLCTRIIGLANSTISIDSDIPTGLQWYLSGPRNKICVADRVDRQGSGLVRLSDIAVGPGGENSIISMGDALTISLKLESEQLSHVNIGIAILDEYGSRLMRLNTIDMGLRPLAINKHRHLTCKTQELCLLPGNYSLSVGVVDANDEIFDLVHHAVDFEIHPKSIFPSGAIPSAANAKVFSLSKWD